MTRARADRSGSCRARGACNENRRGAHLDRFVRGAALALLATAAFALSGCLEVQQNPPFVHGAYAGKKDQLADQPRFHGNRLAWNAAISDRLQGQNEYVRAP